LPHGDLRCASVVIAGQRAARPLGVAADIADADTVDSAFDALSIGVVDKRGVHAAVLLHFHQSILGIVSQVIGIGADDALRLVAVGVVPVFLHASQVCHGMGVRGVVVAVVHSGFGCQVAGGGVVGVTLLGIVADRAAGGLRRGQAVEGIVGEG